MLDQVKLANKMRKLQKELAREIIEVNVGDGAVIIEMNGEQKLKNIKLDSDKIDHDDLSTLEKWLEEGMKEAITKSQQVAAEKMRPVMGQLGNLGL